MRERVAEIIYTEFLSHDSRGKRYPWVDRGNSSIQDNARCLADTILVAMMEPTKAMMEPTKAMLNESHCECYGSSEEEHLRFVKNDYQLIIKEAMKNDH